MVNNRKSKSKRGGKKIDIPASISHPSSAKDFVQGTFSLNTQKHSNYKNELTGSNGTGSLYSYPKGASVQANIGKAYATSGGRKSPKKQNGGHSHKYMISHHKYDNHLRHKNQKMNDNTTNAHHSIGGRKSPRRKQKGGFAPITDNMTILTPDSNFAETAGKPAGVTTQLFPADYQKNPRGYLEGIRKSPPAITIGKNSRMNDGVFSQALSNSTDLKSTYGFVGGAKAKTKHSKSPKKRAKSPKRAKTPKRKHKGGGSDWVHVLNSRQGETYTQPQKMFRAFTKDGQNIPYKDLAYAAVPCSTGYAPQQCDMGVQAYNQANYETFAKGGKKTPKRKSPKRKSPKRKSPTKKTRK